MKYTFAILISIIFQILPVQAQAPGQAADPAPAKTDKRLFGVLPNYRTVESSAPFMPLTPRQKWNIASHDSFDWPTYALAGVMTFLTPNRNDGSLPSNSVARFATRYARSSADQIVGNMMTEAFFPVVLRQDPRYFRIGSGTTWSRLTSALSQIAVSRNDAGRRTLNTSEFLGNAIATGISTTYSPNLRSASSAGQKLAIMISTDTFSNVLKEFGPDLKERFLRRKQRAEQ